MDKKTIYIVAIVIIVLVIAFYITYKSGKFSSSNKKPPKTGDVSAARVEELGILADNLKNDMSGFNMSWNGNLYNEVSLLNDEELVVLSNVFNSKYEQDSGQTLLEWLDNEMFSYDSFSLSTVVDTIMYRLSELGAI